MVSSRSLIDLSPEVRKVCEMHVHGCKNAGIELLITSTFRDCEAQDELYQHGRQPADQRKIVTNARGGQSWHNFRTAWDVVPLIGGKCVWDDQPLWQRIIQIGKAVGAEAGAEWRTFPDLPHFQYVPKGLTLIEAMDRFTTHGTVFI